MLETYDARGGRYSWLNIIDNGTCFQACVLVRVGGGQPTSSKCLQEFMAHWVSWAGWLRIVTTDRGLHNRGYFSKALAAHGVVFNDSQDRTHQSNCGPMRKRWRISQRCFRSIVKDFSPVGEQAVKEAMCEGVATKNEFIRHGGFSSQQLGIRQSTQGSRTNPR